MAVRDGLRARWPSGPELLHAAGLGCAGLVVLIAAGPDDWPAPPLLRAVGVGAWVVGGALVIVLVGRAARTYPGQHVDAWAPRRPRWLLVVPLLALVNGITPYVELKTQAAGTCTPTSRSSTASRTTARPAGFPVTDGNARLVGSSSRPTRARYYVGGEWRLPEVQSTTTCAAPARRPVPWTGDGRSSVTAATTCTPDRVAPEVPAVPGGGRDRSGRLPAVVRSCPLSDLTRGGAVTARRYRRPVPEFRMVADYKPAGDQPKPSPQLTEGIRAGER